MYLTFFTVAVLVLLFLFWKTVVIVPMKEAYVVERLGKFRTILRPGLHILVPFFDKVPTATTREKRFWISQGKAVFPKIIFKLISMGWFTLK